VRLSPRFLSPLSPRHPVGHMFVPRDASSHVARNARSHVCGTDCDGEPLGQMAMREVSWPAHCLWVQRRGRWSVFAMQESRCYMCVVQVMGLENVKRVAARLADMLSGADSGRTSMHGDLYWNVQHCSDQWRWAAVLAPAAHACAHTYGLGWVGEWVSVWVRGWAGWWMGERVGGWPWVGMHVQASTVVKVAGGGTRMTA
jgi:hypothetical protein